MTTETFDDPKAFLAALHGKKRAKASRAREARPGLPRAGRAAPTGLTSLLAPERGSGRPAWSLVFVVGTGYRLFVQGRADLDTGWHPSELACCTAAKDMNR